MELRPPEIEVFSPTEEETLSHPKFGKETISARPDSINNPRFIVGIGSSAGGIEALEELLAMIPETTEHACIIVQHMSPDFETMLPENLSLQSPHTVQLAKEGSAVTPGSFFLIPPGKMITIFHGRLLLEERNEGDPSSFFPIDHFLESLAKDCGPRAIGVILSGTGNDGTTGIKAIKANSGYVIVQTPGSSKFSGMPRSAIASKAISVVLPVSDIAGNIDKYTNRIKNIPLRPHLAHTPNSSTSLDKVFLALRNHHGIDFSCYQEDLIQRRMNRRVKITGCNDLDEYCEYIIKNFQELNTLYDDLLLGVTEFNRHPESLEQLTSIVFPTLASLSVDKDILRVWVVGCSTGEEAFTIAFILSDFLENSQENLDFKIFATDVDDKSLRIASRAIYSVDRVEKLPQRWQKEYISIKDGQAQIKSKIRARVVFANHNVINDAPFSSIDLISCRNLFIYLKSQVKKAVLRSFQFSLKERGFLLLSPKESIPGDNTDFCNLHSEVSIFQCVNPSSAFSGIRKNQRLSKSCLKTNKNSSFISRHKDAEESFLSALHTKMVQEYYPACLVFNEEGFTEYYYGNAKEFCNPLSGKASHQLSDILPHDVYRIVASLRSKISEAKTLCTAHLLVTRTEICNKFLEVDLVDLQTQKHKKALFLVKFRLRNEVYVPENAQNISIPSALEAKIQRLEVELKKAKHKAVESRSEMSTILGQLEIANEELRTSNEELYAGSEELQSTNEELQAVNEELYTVNAECQMRITELSEMSSDVQNIYEVSEIGTLFVDKNLRIRKFNSCSQKIFKLLPEDVGRQLVHFSSTLKVDFCKKVESVLQSMKMFQREITSNDNVTYLMRIAPYRSDDLEVKGVVFVFIDISSLKKAQTKLTMFRDELALLTQETSDFIIRFDIQGRMLWANDSFCDFFSERKIEAKQKSLFADYVHLDSQKDVNQRLKTWRKNKIRKDSFQYKHQAIDGGTFNVLWHTKTMFDKSDTIKQFVSIGRLAN